MSLVSRSSGVSRSTIRRGIRELNLELPGKVRVPGAGRKKLASQNSRLLRELDALLDSAPSGLRWTCLSNHQLAEELGRRGLVVSHQWVHRTLAEWGYLRQGPYRNRKFLSDPDRVNQMRYLSGLVHSYLEASKPVLLVECSAGDEGQALEEQLSPELAVDSLERWWNGFAPSPSPSSLLLCLQCPKMADGWQQNWQRHLAGMAARQQLVITVCHLAPAAICWSGLQQRIVTCYEGWPSQVRVAVAQVGSAGLPPLLPQHCKKPIQPHIRLVPHKFRGDWNYTLEG